VPMETGQHRTEPPGWARPVRVPSTVDGVLHRLLTALALGEFLPGERLPGERDLAELLGVGRGTVRAALARLREQGAIEVRRGRSGGAFVRLGWTPDSGHAVRTMLADRTRELHALSDLRCLVEGMIARTAAARRGPHDIAAIREALARFDAAREPLAAHQADADLHAAVVRAAGNPYLPELSRELLGAVTTGIPIEPYTASGHRRARGEHRALAEAIIDGRPDDAEAVAGRHFRITTDAVRATLRRGSRDNHQDQ
jgi:GntR family transcriptional repressor for pyruvate dehydrogenase complex